MIEAKSDKTEINIKIQSHSREETVQDTVNILHGIYSSVKAAVGTEEAKTFFLTMLVTIQQNIDDFMDGSSDTENIVVVEEEEE